MKYCLQAVKKYVLKPQREGGGEYCAMLVGVLALKWPFC